nr:TLD domain-containing protein 2 isoform X1 [Taeniopygia guttata]
MRGLRYHYQLLPDQDEELPVGCEDAAGEGQRGWEGAPAAAEEEPCALVLSTPSSILRDRELGELGAQLPPRLRQQPWHLLYSTGRDGFSLRTLYRSGARPDCPALLLIRDTEAQAFGAFSASAIRSSSGFYGTGETFLFSFCPELKVRPAVGHPGARLAMSRVPATPGGPRGAGDIWGHGWGQQPGTLLAAAPGLSRAGGRRRIPGSVQGGKLREGDAARLGVTGLLPHGRTVTAQL